jgi:ADP-ribosyl-[dinitrogen reductase] hydrolase
VLGCLLGGAIGDAFGYAIEFAGLSEIRRRYGEDGLRAPLLSKSGRAQVSDDTQMTLFTLEACLDAEAMAASDADAFVARVHRAYLDWLNTQRAAIRGWRPAGSLVQLAALRARRAPGNTCLSALQSGVCGTIDKPINDSKGCGGVMRVAPVGFFPALTPEQAFDRATRAAAVTHGHPSGYLSAGALAAVIRLCLDGADLASAARAALAMVPEREGEEETETALAHALSLAAEGRADHTAAIGALGEGWVRRGGPGDRAVRDAGRALVRGRDPPRGHHGGDSDSTASIAGQLYGAWKGADELPHRWVRRLDALDPLLALTARLVQEPIGPERR